MKILCHMIQLVEVPIAIAVGWGTVWLMDGSIVRHVLQHAEGFLR